MLLNAVILLYALSEAGHMLLQIVGLKGHEMTLYANELNATPPSASGSEASPKYIGSSAVAVDRYAPIVAASRH